MAITIADILVKVGADISGFQKGFSEAKQGIFGLVAAGSKLSEIGKALTTYVTLPLVGIGALAIKTAIEWESAFAGVRKTVDATEQEFAELERQLLKVSQQTPVTPATIAKIAELAGQLGIAREEIAKFSETIAAMATSTNLSAEIAATALAQFINITKPIADPLMSASEQAARLGSVIVELGNNLATTEADIVEFAMRVAGAGTVIKITQAEILGWSAALASLGINAEAGGSAISRVFLNINKAVLEAGDKLQLFASVANTTVEEFTKLFEKDASEAILRFIAGLAKIRDEGGNITAVLKELGLSEIRVTDTLLRASGATDLIRNSLQMANKEYAEHNALVIEANKRYATTESQLTILRNNLQILGITLGKVFLPALVEITQALVPVIQKFAEWAEKNPEIIKIAISILGIVAALGPVIMIISEVISIFTSLISVIRAIPAVFAVLRTVLAALTGPVGIVIAVLSLFYIAWKRNFLGIQDIVKNTIANINLDILSLNNLIPAVTSILENLKNAIFNALVNIVALFVGNHNQAYSIVYNAWNNIYNTVVSIANALSTFISVWWPPVAEAFSVLWNTVVVVTNRLLNAFLIFVQGLLIALAGVITAILQIISGDFTGAWQTMTQIARVIVKAWTDAVIALFGDFAAKIADIISQFVNTIISSFDNLKNTAISLFSSMRDNIMSAVYSLANDMFSAGTAIANRFGDGIRSALNVVLDTVRRMVAEIRSLLPGSDAKKGPLSDLFASGKAFSYTFAQGIQESQNEIAKAITRAINTNRILVKTPAPIIVSDISHRGKLPQPSYNINVIINNPISRSDKDDILSALKHLSYLLPYDYPR